MNSYFGEVLCHLCCIVEEIVYERKTVIMALTPGMKGEATTTVVHENTAASVGAGGVEVFGTPMMIGEGRHERAIVNLERFLSRLNG